MTFLIYLDVCCLNRPFDNQQQERVRLESEAVLLILARCQQRDWNLLGSEAILAEIAQTPNLERQTQLSALAGLAIAQIAIDQSIEVRAASFIAEGFAVFDGLHLACAESGRANVLLTTDDRLLRRAMRRADILQVSVANPVQWLLEVTTDAKE